MFPARSTGWVIGDLLRHVAQQPVQVLPFVFLELLWRELLDHELVIQECGHTVVDVVGGGAHCLASDDREGDLPAAVLVLLGGRQLCGR